MPKSYSRQARVTENKNVLHTDCPPCHQVNSTKVLMLKWVNIYAPEYFACR